jgi:Zn-dependent M28 family amino/carboxypeptidase
MSGDTFSGRRVVKTFWIAFCLALPLAVAGVAALITQPVFRPSAQAPSPAVDPAVLETHVRMLSETLHPRCYDHPENLDAAVRYVERHFVAAGGRTRVQKFSVDELEYSNVIAEFGPEDGAALIVGAHYDSEGETRNPPRYTPGADDNASGTAALLALADLLGRHPPAKRVQLVAYCLEEPPFFATDNMGSAAHAELLNRDRVPVIGMIALEMVGYFSDAPGSQSYPAGIMSLLYPDKGNFIGVVGGFHDMALTRRVKEAMIGASDLPVCSVNAPSLVPGIDYSDHRNYWRYGHEAVMITDTAFYRNTRYHENEDTADTLDYKRMAKVVQGVSAAVMALADAGT